MKTLLLLATVALGGCAAKQLHSGHYKVNTVKTFKGKSVVTLEGLQKEFLLPTDTVQKDDLIYLNIVKNK